MYIITFSIIVALFLPGSLGFLSPSCKKDKSKISDDDLNAYAKYIVKYGSYEKANEIQINDAKPVKVKKSEKPKTLKLFGNIPPSISSSETFILLSQVVQGYENLYNRDSESSQESRKKFLESHIAMLLKAMFETDLFQDILSFLTVSGYVPSLDKQDCIDKIINTWFNSYEFSKAAKKAQGSLSGFESVFIGSNRVPKKILPFASWVTGAARETSSVEYLGVTKAYSFKETPKLRFIKAKLFWDGKIEEVPLIVGLKPEAEFSLFLLCFVAKQGGDCKFKLGESATIKISGKKVCDKTSLTNYPYNMEWDM